MLTKEEIIAGFKEIDERIARQKAEAARPKTPEKKREERWTKKPELIFNAAADHNAAAQELARAEAVRREYQAHLDRWWQSMRDAQTDRIRNDNDYNPIELYERGRRR
jgi:hypothetical protein